MKRFLFLFALFLGSACLQVLAVEGAPNSVQYQGTVLDGQGAPLAPTAPTVYKMEFRLWSQITGGTLIWSEQQLVTVSNGQFSVRLGEGQAAADSVVPQLAQSNLGSAFAAKDRFIGITVKTTPSATEISPRLAFLSSPYAFVANTVTRVSQQPGTVSNMRLTSIGYATRKEDTGAVSVALTVDKHTNLIGAGPRGTVANLPVSGGLQEVLIAKIDATDKVVAISPPPNGKINGSTQNIRLKIQGESVTLQNIGGDDWWIVKDTRDNTPVGTIISYAATEPPPGYLACDGSSRLRDDHPDLFAAVGTTWGSASEANDQVLDANRFNLPNFSGRFLRGIDPNNDGVDNDAGSRVNLVAGGNAGRRAGSYQKDDFALHGHTNGSDPGHIHPATLTSSDRIKFAQRGDTDLDGNDNGDDAINDGNPQQSTTPFYLRFSSPPTISKAFTGIVKTEDTGGSETRPENVGVRYCIKY